MAPEVDLVVPVKSLRHAKTRLRGVAGGSETEHTELVLAMVTDTVLSARAASGVGTVIVVSDDPRVDTALRATGIEVVGEGPVAELNSAYRHGELALRRARSPRIAALQADLPALRPEDLDAALREAGPARAFCPDRDGTGTTLLIAARGAALDPRFGARSAAAHRHSGARQLTAPLPTLRCDVDTPHDLRHAATLGLGQYTRSLLRAPSPLC